VVAAVARPHDVIEEDDPEDAPRFREPPRDLEALRARRRIAARVVVADEQRARADRGRRLDVGATRLVGLVASNAD
jgi:hypothetical protein